MSWKQKLKIQALLAFLLSIFGCCVFYYARFMDPLALSVYDIAPMAIGVLWLAGSLFALWYRED